MFASILIISISLVLLVYWFRYSCILLLRGYAEQSAAPAGDNRFNFGATKSGLSQEAELGAFHEALLRDYQLITYLLENAPGLELSSFEDRLLLWDCKAMQFWYRLTRVAAPEQ